MASVCIIGDILVDVTLKSKNIPLKMRPGGIIHAARALWAMEVEYCLAYFAPSYLVKEIEEYMITLGNPKLIYLGEVDRCPYVMLINEAKEIGNQGYEFPLRDKIEIKYNSENLEKLTEFSNVLIISGNFHLKKVLAYLNESCKISIDVANNVSDIGSLKNEDVKFEKIFVSTSSELFRQFLQKGKFEIQMFVEQFIEITNKIILKENRGGSRAYDFEKKELISVGSQTQPIVHSVGVGDVYCAVCLWQNTILNFEKSLSYASWIATEYALTTFPLDFKSMTSKILKIEGEKLIHAKGIILPWETRKNINIYIAAPDFDFVDTHHIELLDESLKYHNFMPRRPVQENGQMKDGDSQVIKRKFFYEDMKLLDECQILVAVLLYNDPGTLIEIGIAAERQMPTFVYDPKNIAQNCMLTQIPNLVSDDLDLIISEIFIAASKI